MAVADLESCDCSRVGSTMTDLDKMALLPCPFCGNTNVQMVTIKDEDGDVLHAVDCPKCGCNGAPHIAAMDDPRPAAAAAWNQRTALLTAPPGCVLVPVVPTGKMLRAALRAPCSGHPETGGQSCHDIYRAMLAAAPEPKA